MNCSPTTGFFSGPKESLIKKMSHFHIESMANNGITFEKNLTFTT